MGIEIANVMLHRRVTQGVEKITETPDYKMPFNTTQPQTAASDISRAETPLRNSPKKISILNY